MDEKIIGMVFLAYCLFMVLLFIAWVVNKVARKPLMNGAAIFFWFIVFVDVAILLVSTFSPRTTVASARYAGQNLGASTMLLVPAYFLAKRFRRRKDALKTAEAAEHS